MNSPFDITGSTADTDDRSAEDLLREICGDDTDGTDGTGRTESAITTGESSLVSRITIDDGDSNGDECETGGEDEPRQFSSAGGTSDSRDSSGSHDAKSLAAGTETEDDSDSLPDGTGEQGSGSGVRASGSDQQVDGDGWAPSSTAESLNRATISIDIDRYLKERKGRYFVYDLETTPDFSRFPRPVPVKKERITVDLQAICKSSVDGVKDYLKKDLLQEDQIEELMALENSSKKPRAGVLQAATAALGRCGEDNTIDEWRKYSLDPWRCQIVSMAWQFVGDDHPMCLVNMGGPEDEYEILTMFWHLVAAGTRVGFNILGFDDNVIIARSMLLGVQSTCRLETGRYSKTCVDLMYKIFGGLAGAIGAKDLARMLKLHIPVEDVVAEDVLALYESQQFDRLRAYNMSDVSVEMQLLTHAMKYISF